VRRAILIALSLAVVLLAAACGSEGVVQATPQNAATLKAAPAAPPAPVTPASKLKGDPTAGAKVFQSAGCIGCHTLAAAHSTGTVGPNLDQAKPSFQLATARVTLGKGVMPKFGGQLTDQQIADVAAYVVKSTGGTPP
jgi:mono/diheme cytochrome c family protein